ncbi:MAG: heparinase II/III family protein [bacterium]
MLKKTGVLLPLLVVVPLLLEASDLPPESHPCILYDTAVVDSLQSRILREPYATWWSGVQSMANIGLNFNFSGQPEKQKALYCKVLGFAYVITGNTAYAAKCLEGLQLIDPNGDWGSELHFEADPMMLYAEAYDVLKGSGYDMSAADPLIRSLLADKAQDFRNNLLILFYNNNWRVRYHAALGLAAFALADHGSAESWHDHAESNVMAIFNNYQVAGAGAWAEGPYYLKYSADVYVPYMLAFHRLISGADLLLEPTVQMAHDWSWKIRMPDGRRPNYEDSQPEYFFSGFFASVYQNAETLQWDYTAIPETAGLFAEDHWRVDAICFYDDSITPVEPAIDATMYLPEAGNMVFRSGWGADDIYLLLIGEHGDARTNGGMHDHPDATSFILAAYGEILTIDGGYISWAQRDIVNNAKNHSLILVDGQGPPKSTYLVTGDADAYLTGFYTTPRVKFCADSTYYRNTSFKRSVLFVENIGFIIRDQISASSSHTYNWRLHGNGGGTSGGSFALNADGAVWSRAGASLRAVVASANGLRFTTTVDTHSFAYNQILTHNTLDVACRGSQVDLVSRLLPLAADEPLSLTEKLLIPGGAGLKWEDGLALVSGGGIVSLGVSETGLAPLQTDAGFCCAGFEDGELAYFDLHECQTFVYNGIQHFAADQKMVFSIDCSGERWEGCAAGEGLYKVKIYTAVEPQDVVFNETPVNFNFDSGITEFAFTGSGNFSIALLTFADPLLNSVTQEALGRFPLVAHPNPFNNQISIAFELPYAASINLSLYDLRGCLVREFLNGYRNEGVQRIILNAENLPGGVYLVRLQVGRFQSVAKIALIR